MSKPATLMHPSNTKLNAAGLTPDQSLMLPERMPEQDEKPIMQTVHEIYTSHDISLCSQVFSPQVVFTMSNGNVSVGMAGLQSKVQAMQSGSRQGQSASLRLLATPETLAPRTMCIDLVISCDGNESTHTLLVVKRKQSDGQVTSITEEEGHRRATAPLAARATSAGNFCSPTDNMLSPCTSKLNLAKKKHHLKGKPTTLFASQMASKAPSHLSDEMEI